MTLWTRHRSDFTDCLPRIAEAVRSTLARCLDNEMTHVYWPDFIAGFVFGVMFTNLWFYLKRDQ